MAEIYNWKDRGTAARADLAGSEDGAIGYILMWLMGIPASVLFVVFLLRGCT